MQKPSENAATEETSTAAGATDSEDNKTDNKVDKKEVCILSNKSLFDVDLFKLFILGYFFELCQQSFVAARNSVTWALNEKTVRLWAMRLFFKLKSHYVCCV